ncbi:MAG: signal peptidase I [Peptostreptococcaceae bacterium]|nr:signal peptidase I [Peptostreptococcaceae bacterium]
MSEKNHDPFLVFLLRIAIILTIIGIIKSVFIENVSVLQTSMNDTLYEGDLLLINKLAKNKLERGDIIIFRNPDKRDPADYEYFTKRVIGLENDVVKIQNGKVSINGEVLLEDYVDPNKNQTNVSGEWTVQENYLFVLGDNRDSSLDSRKFGTIPQAYVLGKVFLRVYPFEKFGKVE